MDLDNVRRGRAFLEKMSLALAAEGVPNEPRSRKVSIALQQPDSDLQGVENVTLMTRAARDLSGLSEALNDAEIAARENGDEFYGVIQQRHLHGARAQFVVMPLSVFAKLVNTARVRHPLDLS